MNERKYNKKINRTAINCWTMLDIFIVITYMFRIIIYDSSLTYGLIFMLTEAGPLVLTYIANKKLGRYDLSIRYFIAAGFMIFYAFALFTDSMRISFIYIVPMISIMIIYRDMFLMAIMYLISLILNILYIVVIIFCKGISFADVTLYICQVLCIVVSGIFLYIIGTVQKKHLKDLENNALKDHLTGVYNRKFIDYKCEEIFEHGNKNYGVSFTAIDIDNFKQFNSLFGHDMGDTVLATLSNLIIKEIENFKEMYLIRIGGDEFIILSALLPYNVFVEIMGNIRKRIEMAQISYKENTVSINISMGCANTQIDHLLDYLSLYKKADERLYIAKKSGKNTVIFKENINSPHKI